MRVYAVCAVCAEYASVRVCDSQLAIEFEIFAVFRTITLFGEFGEGCVFVVLLFRQVSTVERESSAFLLSLSFIFIFNFFVFSLSRGSCFQGLSRIYLGCTSCVYVRTYSSTRFGRTK